MMLKISSRLTYLKRLNTDKNKRKSDPITLVLLAVALSSVALIGCRSIQRMSIIIHIKDKTIYISSKKAQMYAKSQNILLCRTVSDSHFDKNLSRTTSG